MDVFVLAVLWCTFRWQQFSVAFSPHLNSNSSSSKVLQNMSLMKKSSKELPSEWKIFPNQCLSFVFFPIYCFNENRIFLFDVFLKQMSQFRIALYLFSVQTMNDGANMYKRIIQMMWFKVLCFSKMVGLLLREGHNV